MTLGRASLERPNKKLDDSTKWVQMRIVKKVLVVK